MGPDTGQVCGRKGVAGEKNDAELQAARALPVRIDIQGRCVVADALCTQHETAQTNRDGGGAYLFAVEGQSADAPWAAGREMRLGEPPGTCRLPPQPGAEQTGRENEPRVRPRLTSLRPQQVGPEEPARLKRS